MVVVDFDFVVVVVVVVVGFVGFVDFDFVVVVLVIVEGRRKTSFAGTLVCGSSVPAFVGISARSMTTQNNML